MIDPLIGLQSYFHTYYFISTTVIAVFLSLVFALTIE